MTVAFVSSRSAEAGAEERVEWNDEWPRFGLAEGGATLGSTVLSLYAERSVDASLTPRWTGAILFDVPVRDALRSDSPRVQKVFADYSDKVGRVLAFFPYVVDAGVMALGVHRNPDVALQMFLIDVQSLSLTGAVTLLTEKFVARQRPYARDCDARGVSGHHTCGGAGDNLSFFSGHTSAVFTSAGLTCVHHEHLPLWGGGLVDRWACTWALGLASFTGVARIISDNHYASDVVVGAGVGLASGYLLPKWLHYGFGSSESAHASRRRGVRMMPTFSPAPGAAGIGVAGTF